MNFLNVRLYQWQKITSHMKKLRKSKNRSIRQNGLGILRYFHEINDRIKPVLNKLAYYEPNPEIPPFSIDDAKNVTANLINPAPIIEDLNTIIT